MRPLTLILILGGAFILYKNLKITVQSTLGPDVDNFLGLPKTLPIDELIPLPGSSQKETTLPFKIRLTL